MTNEKPLSDRVAVEHDGEYLHIFYIEDRELCVSLGHDEILKLIAYVFKNDVVIYD